MSFVIVLGCVTLICVKGYSFRMANICICTFFRSYAKVMRLKFWTFFFFAFRIIQRYFLICGQIL